MIRFSNHDLNTVQKTTKVCSSNSSDILITWSGKKCVFGGKKIIFGQVQQVKVRRCHISVMFKQIRFVGFGHI